MKSEYRAFNFDLDTKAMERVMGSKTKGYRQIKKTMENLDFEHRQWSGYRSKKPLTKEETLDCVVVLGEQNPWLAECVRVLDVTNSGKHDYDFTEELKTAIRTADKQTKQDDVAENNKSDENVTKSGFKTDRQEKFETISFADFMRADNSSAAAKESKQEYVNE